MLTSHVLARMVDRGFSEIDLRVMLEDALRLVPNGIPGRWKVYTMRGFKHWVVVLEPDLERRVLTVVTAYPDVNR